MTRTVGARATVATIAAVVALLAAAVGQASAWTWSSARYPAGAVNACGPTSGGGILLYHGMYYVPGAAHVEATPGQNVWECADGSHVDGFIGHVADTQWTGTWDYANDMSLKAVGTDPITPYVRVSNGWTNAPIEGYGQDLPAGSWLCLTGSSPQTMAAGGYRCGQTAWPCYVATSQTCQFFSAGGLSDNGDSGALVWWYSGSGVQLYGIVNSSYGYNGQPADDGASFTTIRRIAAYSWSTSQAWPGYGIVGNDGSGCLVTVNGCG